MKDGTIYIVYDHNRTPNGEVLMANFNENGIRAVRAITDQARPRMVIAPSDQATSM